MKDRVEAFILFAQFSVIIAGFAILAIFSPNSAYEGFAKLFQRVRTD